ncbi:MAG: DUF3326 domain-containing protein [Deltaproteobacteria bacterium]|nr:DUF3326 domain-containing protein [Deltaproteobacteria bacterium]
MFIYEKEVTIPPVKEHSNLLEYMFENVQEQIDEGEIPIRFVITRTDDKGYYCELGVISDMDNLQTPSRDAIFGFNKRSFQNTDQFNAVLIVPTGIGAEIGGHSGDAAPVARLLASVCDNLITHPNVVNASDINELPENALYVEGSIISRLLMGTVGLQKVRSNRVMLVIDEHKDEHFQKAAINLASAARASFGLDCPLVLTLKQNVSMKSVYSRSGRAVGKIENFENLYAALSKHREGYDAVALSSVIKVPPAYHTDYYLGGMVNPWGGVEAMLTHCISLIFDVPSAHSPMMESMDILNMDVGVVDPRMAAEIVSVTFLFSVMKGLHRSPKIISDTAAMLMPGIISAADIDCIVIPDGCVGLPTLAAIEQEIPVIAVRENRNNMKNKLSDYPFKPGKLIYVENYLEAVGIMAAMKAGIAPETVRRPISFTNVVHEAQLEKMAAQYSHEKKDEGKDKKKMGLSLV